MVQIPDITLEKHIEYTTAALVGHIDLDAMEQADIQKITALFKEHLGIDSLADATTYKCAAIAATTTHQICCLFSRMEATKIERDRQEKTISAMRLEVLLLQHEFLNTKTGKKYLQLKARITKKEIFDFQGEPKA